MQLIDSLDKASLGQETILTIGTFDGVHRGHQALISAVVEQARATGRMAALITFHPHPAAILAPERAPRYLTLPGERLALLESLGLDLVALLPFDRKLAAIPPRVFMETTARCLYVRELWVGAGFCLGRERKGDVPRLKELGRELGYEVIVLGAVSGGEQGISSSRIRSLLREGCIEKASALLGRYPRFAGGVQPDLTGIVLQVDPGRALPAAGVFAAFAVLGSERVPALVSFSSDPGLEGRSRSAGVQFLDADRDIMSCELTVELVSRLRDALPVRLEIDRQAARRILDRVREETGIEAPPPEARQYWYYEKDHTADRALRVGGRDLADLFVGAGRGMFDLTGDAEGVEPQVWRTIRLEAGDREELLVEWLNELLFLVEQEELLLTEFYIESLTDATPTAKAALAAHVGGAVSPVTRAHIKAATYHDLKLVESKAGWSATITFDV